MGIKNNGNYGHGRAESALWKGSGYGSGTAGSNGSGYGSGFGSDGISGREGYGYSFGVHESGLRKGKGGKECISNDKSSAISATSRLELLLRKFGSITRMRTVK